MTKNTLNKNYPLGIFDSGVGGLTVVNKISELIPFENIIYFADTANVPYGDKTPSQIQNFTLKITKLLVQHKIKLLLIGCNYSSAVSMALIKKTFTHLKVFGLIEGGVEKAITKSKNKIVGVIATTGTIKSEAYQKLLKKKKAKTVIAIPTPQLVPLVEQGDLNSKNTLNILKKYLSLILVNNADTLILGCTHYPFLIPAIKKIAPNLTIIDPATEIVKKGRDYLLKEKLLNNENEKNNITYFVSGSTVSLLTVGKKFHKVSRKNIINIPLFYQNINSHKKLFLANP